MKEIFVLITDPAEIESIKANNFDSIIGGEVNGQWYAYKFSLEDWRARQKEVQA